LTGEGAAPEQDDDSSKTGGFVRMAEEVDCLVIGAGVVGLAVARRLAHAGREVILVEAESAIGMHTSARHSGVIHAGLLSAKTLKGRLCRSGKDMLYAYCAEHNVGHKRIGKLIIAPVAAGEEGLAALQATKARAEENGLTDLRLIGADEVRDMEPALETLGALFSPSSGIVDPHDLMLAYLGDLEDKGGSLVLESPVLSGRAGDGRIEIDVGGLSPLTISCRSVVNSAGFNAQKVAASIAGIPKPTIPQRLLAKGSYFVLAGKSPFSRLIYPVHTKSYRSMHTTLDLAGQLRFGPDMEWVEEVDYRVDVARAPAFYDSIRRFWPALPDGALKPGWAGVRPKIGWGQSTAELDFLIQGPETHGIDGLINLYGIESPGLTSSLAIAEDVAHRLAPARGAA
jgi:L-2-hydroxyglutarate oxidase LhgO